jgi:uncharacterized membrane protein YdjX (TVP38/TMEM64 family)
MMQWTKKHTRALAVAFALILLPVLARVFGLIDRLSPTHLRELVDQAGEWGALAFVTLFVGAVVGQVPGLPFVLAAPALFRLPVAWILCFTASNLAVAVNFALVRRFGGQPLTEITRPRLRLIIEKLDDHPIRTVALLRFLTLVFPPVTSVLALTRLRARDHAIGSAIGMLIPITLMLMFAAAVLERVP